ncbi:MAG: hypothetical protein LBH22_07935 [Bacteroidales bacterium]|jgi:hypothetical protein|nr:hypothetical protein [Bacteroidales bacterium]
MSFWKSDQINPSGLPPYIGTSNEIKVKEYFKLQYKIIKRKLSDSSPPIVGYLLALLILLAFVGLSMFLFHKMAFAPYVYVLISVYFTSKLSEIKRNDFLKICFENKPYRKLRILENLIVALPFVIFLIYKQQFYPIIILVVITVLIALLTFKTTYSITIPTPFYKKPFEFTVGFRTTFFMFFMAYGLAVIAAVVDNFNLGMFSLILIFLTILTYYLKPENEYFVWSYSFTPAKFLVEKIKTAFLFSFYLCSPILILLSIFYFENLGVMLLFTLLGYLYLTTLILAKYSAYPNEMSLPQVIILVFCLVFPPPILIVVIPIFASKSVNKLKEFLK